MDQLVGGASSDASNVPQDTITQAVTDKATGKRRRTLDYNGKEDDALYIGDKVGRIRGIQRNRAGYEKQWLVNTAFLYGRQHFDVTVMPRSGDLTERIVWEIKDIQRTKRDKARRTVNYIMPLWRSLMATVIQMKSKVFVQPETQDDRDISAARVGQEALEDHWQNVNKSNPTLSQDYSGMVKVMLRLFNFVTVTGRGWLMPYFNASAKGKLFLNGEIVEGDVGSVETKVYSPFDVFPDPTRRWIATQDIMSVDAIGEEYDIDIEPEDIGITNTDRQLQRLLKGTDLDEISFNDAAVVHTFFHLPTKRHPEGQFSVFTRNKMLLPPTDLPMEYRGVIPLFKFGYLDIMGGEYPQSAIEQVIPLQEEYNYTAERISGYKKWMSGKLLMPFGCRPETKWDDEIGQIVKYDENGGKPEYLAPGTSAMSFLLREFDRIRRDMEDIMARHDVSLSRVPSGIKSGIAIENLAEADNGQMAPQLIDNEEQLGFYGQMVLDIMETRYTEPRLIGITGKNLAVDVKVFKGEHLKGQKRVKISLGSNLPQNREARAKYIMDLGDRGLLKPEKVLEHLEFSDVEGIFHDIDVQQERMEILEMSKGVEVIPAEWENHTVRIAILTEFMKGSDYRKLRPDIQDIFIAHLRMHRVFLQNEMSAATQLTKPAAKPALPAPGAVA